MDCSYPFVFEAPDGHFTEPNSNVEDKTAMHAMEYLYFTSDELEYYPNDWAPSCNFSHASESATKSIDLLETSLLLDALCEESCRNDPLKRNISGGGSKTKVCIPSNEWHRSMPTVYPVSKDEYNNFINQHNADCRPFQCFAEGSTESVCQNITVRKTKKLLSMRNDFEDKLLSENENVGYYDSCCLSMQCIVEGPSEAKSQKKPIGNTKIKNYKERCDMNKKINVKKPRKKVNENKLKTRSMGKSRSLKMQKKCGIISFCPIPRIPMNSIINRKNPRNDQKRNFPIV